MSIAKAASEEERCNRVVLVGRVSGTAEERTLPSGDVIATFRVVVDRPAGHGSRQTVDALECVAWSGRARRTVSRWRTGDVVRVEGAVRRRFFRTPAAGAASRVEVEVATARLIRRGSTA